jgi:hypothetical protein
MQIVSKVMKQRAAGLAVVLAILDIATLAHAIPLKQLLRKGDKPMFTGKCCFSFGDSVTVKEPADITPVLVTFTADYQATSVFSVGIAVNGHPCQDTFVLDSFGPAYFRSRAFQWVLLPSDGLIKGNNTITVCGGAASDPNSTLTLGFRTLAVTISN